MYRKCHLWNSRWTPGQEKLEGLELVGFWIEMKFIDNWMGFEFRTFLYIILHYFKHTVLSRSNNNMNGALLAIVLIVDNNMFPEENQQIKKKLKKIFRVEELVVHFLTFQVIPIHKLFWSATHTIRHGFRSNCTFISHHWEGQNVWII